MKLLPIDQVRSPRAPFRRLISGAGAASLALWSHLEIPLAWGLILAGGILRWRRYEFNPSLWVDEASLALNILSRSFAELTGPLDHFQVAPMGFLWVVKAATIVLGSSEYALRLVPLIAGIGSLIVCLWVARSLLDPYGVLLTVSLVALNWPLIRYSTELKQYSTDVLIALLLIWLVLRRGLPSAQSSASPIAFYAFIAAVSMWLSYPAVFTLGSVAIADGLDFLQHRKARRWAPALTIYGIWAISGLFLIVASRSTIADQRLQSYWNESFLPLLPSTLGELRVFIQVSEEIQSELLGLGALGGGVLLAIIGAIRFLAEDRRVFALLTLPLLLAAIASGLRLYPFQGRLLLFSVPLVVLLIGNGVSRILRGMPSGSRFAAAAIILGLVLYRPIEAVRDNAWSPKGNEELRPLLEYYLTSRRPTDKLYVYYGAARAFEYYRLYTSLDPGPTADVVQGRAHRSDPQRYLDEIDNLRGSSRVWLAFTHEYRAGPVGNELEFIMRYVDCLGERLDVYQRWAAVIYSYDLTLADERTHECEDRSGFDVSQWPDPRGTLAGDMGIPHSTDRAADEPVLVVPDFSLEEPQSSVDSRPTTYEDESALGKCDEFRQ